MNPLEDLGIEDIRLNDDEQTLREVGDFCCGADDPLNTFLQSAAFDYNSNGHGNTYLVKDIESGNIIAYYTLKASAMQIKKEENEKFESVASIELARFAVDHRYQNQTYGRLIFLCCIIPKVQDVQRIIGIRNIIVFVDELNKRAIRFYKNFGFFLGSEEVSNYIEEDFNEKCKIMYVNIDNLVEYMINPDLSNILEDYEKAIAE